MTPEPIEWCDEEGCDRESIGKVNNVGYCKTHMKSVIQRTLSPAKDAIRIAKRMAEGKEPM